MKKTISLFKRNYEGDRLIYNEIVSGAEWVVEGKGEATIKYDGTCCLVRDGQLYKRYDRKLTKSKAKQLKQNKSYIPKIEDYKAPPDGWQAAESEPDRHTGHWPGWMLIGDGPEDKWHREAFYATVNGGKTTLKEGTYELVGPKVQGNPYQMKTHHLWNHGSRTYRDFIHQSFPDEISPRDFEHIKTWLKKHYEVEGIVWHHPDGRMVKVKRRDFGLIWPVTDEIRLSKINEEMTA